MFTAALFVLSIAAFAPPGTVSAASSWGNTISNSPTTNSIGAGYFMHAWAGTVNETHTEFTVPTVKCTAPESSKAVYITGIDQPPETREAAGISFGCNSGTPTYSGFYVIAGIFTNYGTIHVGDHMSATVELSPTSHVTIILKDLTSGHSWSKTATGTDPGATRTDFSWNVVLFPGPMLPNFGKLLTFNDWAMLNNHIHYIGYWSVNSAVTTEAVTMETAPGNKLAYPSFINDEAKSFNLIWVASA
jgi:Peptidase A4 family